MKVLMMEALKKRSFEDQRPKDADPEVEARRRSTCEEEKMESGLRCEILYRK